MEWHVPTGPLDGLWGRQFKKIETRIATAEHDSLRVRWESGKHLLMARTDKMFDRGFRQALEHAHGLKQQEISARMRFAEAYPSEQELTDAVSKFGTWHQLCAHGLPKTRQRTPQAPEPFHWLNAIGDLKELIERRIAEWPSDAQALVPRALRDLAHALELDDHALTIDEREHVERKGGAETARA
jgi:hypothetical protein